MPPAQKGHGLGRHRLTTIQIRTLPPLELSGGVFSCAGRIGNMKAKRPTPPECPICTSREVVARGWTGPGIKILDAHGAGRIRTPKPRVIRYRCKQCGHKFTY